MRTAVVLLALLVAVCAVGELAARRVLDASVEDAVTMGLSRASSERASFASVTADERGWAAPDLVRGQLSGVDAEAVDGDIDGVPVSRVAVSTGTVDLGAGTVADLTLTATLDSDQLLDLGRELTGVDLAGTTVTAVSADVARVDAQVLGASGSLDVRLLPDGDGGLVASPVGAFLAGSAVDPALVAGGDRVVIDGARLPDPLSVTGAEVRESGTGVEVDVVITCPGACPVVDL